MFSVDEIRKFGLDQLNSQEINQALEAFNGFAALFSKSWVEAYFQGYSPMFVRAFVIIWNNYCSIRHLPGVDKLVERWRAGIHEDGVMGEVRVFSCLVRGGAQVELFPSIGGRLPDCRLSAAEKNPWVYMEVSQRGLSKVRQFGQQVLGRASDAAAQAVPGKHGKVGILRMPTPDEADRLIQWLLNGPSEGEAFENLAEFYTGAVENAIGENDVIELRVAKPRMFCVSFEGEGSAIHRRGTACLGISDSGAQDVLEREASQLPENESGIVVLDISSVIGGYNEWTPLIRRRFQPTINTRISAVVLFQHSVASDGLLTKGEVLTNPYCKRPINQPTLELLKTIIQ